MPDINKDSLYAYTLIETIKKFVCFFFVLKFTKLYVKMILQYALV